MDTPKLKKLLNIGGGSKSIPLPAGYEEYEHVLLDISPGPDVDIVCDARELNKFGFLFDVIYCAHNLEHYSENDARFILRAMWCALKVGGLVDIIVPNIVYFINQMQLCKHDIEDIAYTSPAGPIRYIDILYGYQQAIEKNPFMKHSYGFTPKSLENALIKAGFENVRVFVSVDQSEIRAAGFKS